MGCGISAKATPMASVRPVQSETIANLRQDLVALMNKPDWDDGSLAPVLIRLGWHSSGTYTKATGKGGSNGATMRFEPEASDPENAGLDMARAHLEPIKKKYPGVSYSDLWILAAYVAIEVTGGPVIEFRAGRVDATEESEVPSNGLLPDAELEVNEDVKVEGLTPEDLDVAMCKREEATGMGMRRVFNRMGFNDREIVALISGGHVYGRCHKERSGYAGPWVEEMTKFSNEYCADLIEDEWAEVTHDSKECPVEMRPIPGKRQWVNERGKGQQMMLVSDMMLRWDPEFRKVVEEYAKDEDLLKTEFGVAFKKLTELGVDFS